jgi:glycosyltransferase involved in cell wall biosynthesis
MTKILYIGFGISPFVTGGAILYQESVIKAFRNRGFEIVCFYAAPRYQLIPRATPFLREWTRDGLRFIELVNPPHHWGHHNNPQEECRHSIIEKLTGEILDRERPDLIHFHELQLHTASTIAASADRGIPVIKTIHNYFDLCPQRDLMFRGKTVCEDFEEGGRCVTCLKTLQRNKMHLYYPACLPFRGVFNFLVERALHRYPSRYGPTDYARRRQYFVEQLNQVQCIHCSSEGSAAILKRYGVHPDRIQIMPIATETTSGIRPKPRRGNSGPVVFGFMGGPHRHKGFEVLIDAFSRLDQNRAKLLIWNTGKKDSSPIPRLNVEYRGRYLPVDINSVFSEMDVGLIPSIWQEVFGLIGVEWLTAKIPVIGSDIGGIPQWLVDRHNGFLVKPGDPADLAEAMNRFVREPSLVREFQERMAPPQTFAEHIDSLMGMYDSLIASRGRVAPAVR